MGKYYCKICEYKTDRKNDMSRHLLSNRHQEKVNEQKDLRNHKFVRSSMSEHQYICPYCHNDYKSSNSLSKHIIRCPLKNDKVGQLEKENGELSTKITALENDKKQMARQIEIMQTLFHKQPYTFSS